MSDENPRNGAAPRAFAASIGGYMGPSYRLELQGRELRYTRCSHGYEVQEGAALVIEPSAWQRFGEQLDALDV